MRQISRKPIPKTLQRNATRWTNELLAEVESRGGYRNVCTKYKHRYKQQDVQNTLLNMYGPYCCYCESDYEKTGYPRIEHRQPASKFPDLSFAWENLHLSCEKCNGAKSDSWNDTHPILDPVLDTPNHHLKANAYTGKIEAVTNRGDTTIRHTQLNRLPLVKARKHIADLLLAKIVARRSDPSQMSMLKRELEQLLSPNPSTGIIDTEYTMLLQEIIGLHF